MKVLCLLLLGVVALSVAPATNAVQLDRLALESFAKVHGTRCGELHCPYDNAICCKGKTGNVARGERKATCCPNGYKCSFPDQRPTTCVRAKAVSVSINPSLSSGSSPSTASQAGGSMSSMAGSVSAPSMSASADPMASSAASSGMGSVSAAMGSAAMGSVAGPSGSSSMAMDGSSAAAAPGAVQPAQNVPKFRQNIIIVKNINVLTKLQQPPKGGSSSGPAPAPQPAQESSSEESSSEESSSSSRSGSSAESSESGSQ